MAINVKSINNGQPRSNPYGKITTIAPSFAGVDYYDCYVPYALTNEQLEWHMRNHGLFVGYAPINNPKYAVCVITERSGSSGSAARSVASVMKELLKK